MFFNLLPPASAGGQAALQDRKRCECGPGRKESRQQRSLRTGSTHTRLRRCGIPSPQRGDSPRGPALAKRWCHGTWVHPAACAVVCPHTPHIVLHGRIQSHARWDLKYKASGACPRATDWAKQFQDGFTCAQCRGSRDALAVLSSGCRETCEPASTSRAQHEGQSQATPGPCPCTSYFRMPW